MEPNEKVVDQVVEDTKKPVEEPTPAAEPAPDEVLPPEDDAPDAPQNEDEKPDDSEPTAADLKAQLEEKDAEIAALKEGKAEPAPVTPKAGERVNMGQVFLNKTAPEKRKEFLLKKDDPAAQFDVMVDTVDYHIGAVMHDQVTPAFVELARANITLKNEIEILKLQQSDPDFKNHEADVRQKLSKADWKLRGGDGAVAEMYHTVRGSKANGKTTPKVVSKTPLAPEKRSTLKDMAAGGGASPKPAGIRLTKEQEADFQSIVNDGVALTRAEYYAKYKSRVDQAKAQGKKAPATYRG